MPEIMPSNSSRRHESSAGTVQVDPASEAATGQRTRGLVEMPSQMSPQLQGARLGADAWTTAAVQPCRLSDLEIGCRGCVVSVGGEDTELRRRLLEMGFCNGTCVEAVREAPLGDPIEFRVRGYHLSLRAEQARHVVVLPQLPPAR